MFIEEKGYKFSINMVAFSHIIHYLCGAEEGWTKPYANYYFLYFIFLVSSMLLHKETFYYCTNKLYKYISTKSIFREIKYNIIIIFL